MFKQAFSMFTPFARRDEEGSAATESEKAPAATAGSDLDELRRQLADMQKKVDKLGGGEK
jgi:polyhydroxyalkanoate synthesis regulator protein